MATVGLYGPYYMSSSTLGNMAPGGSWSATWLLDRPEWYDATHSVSASIIGGFSGREAEVSEVSVQLSDITIDNLDRGRRREFYVRATFTNVGPTPIEFMVVYLSTVSK